MRKQEARNIFRNKRAQLTPGELSRFDDLLLIQFQQVNLPFLSYVFSFFPAIEKGEADTGLITRYLQFCNPGLQVAYPRTAPESAMEAILPANDIFVPNAYNIMEPAAGTPLAPDLIDLVLVPLLAFDEKGNRAGYGKGFYDRYLAQCRPDCIKIGLSYFEPVPLLDDANEYDVPLDFCITPQKAYVF